MPRRTSRAAGVDLSRPSDAARALGRRCDGTSATAASGRRDRPPARRTGRLGSHLSRRSDVREPVGRRCRGTRRHPGRPVPPQRRPTEPVRTSLPRGHGAVDRHARGLSRRPARRTAAPPGSPPRAPGRRGSRRRRSCRPPWRRAAPRARARRCRRPGDRSARRAAPARGRSASVRASAVRCCSPSEVRAAGASAMRVELQGRQQPVRRRHPAQPARQQGVLGDAELLGQRQPLRQQRRDRPVVDVDRRRAVDEHPALRRRVEPRGQVAQRRLARARPAGQREQLAGGDVEADVVQDGRRPEGVRDALHLAAAASRRVPAGRAQAHLAVDDDDLGAGVREQRQGLGRQLHAPARVDRARSPSGPPPARTTGRRAAGAARGRRRRRRGGRGWRRRRRCRGRRSAAARRARGRPTRRRARRSARRRAAPPDRPGRRRPPPAAAARRPTARRCGRRPGPSARAGRAAAPPTAPSAPRSLATCCRLPVAVRWAYRLCVGRCATQAVVERRSARRARGPSVVASTPCSHSRPPDGRSCSASTCSRLDLPLPDGR